MSSHNFPIKTIFVMWSSLCKGYNKVGQSDFKSMFTGWILEKKLLLFYLTFLFRYPQQNYFICNQCKLYNLSPPNKISLLEKSSKRSLKLLTQENSCHRFRHDNFRVSPFKVFVTIGSKRHNSSVWTASVSQRKKRK